MELHHVGSYMVTAFLNSSLSFSGAADPFILLGVFSVLREFSVRSIIRATYMRQPAVCNYRQDHKRYHSRNGLSPCIAVRFVIGQNYENEKKDAPLRGKEQNAHGDIVVLPMTENMNSVVSIRNH